MNVRILRMCERHTIGGNCRLVPNLGQIQPVLFGYSRGVLQFRAESVADGQPCWMVLPLPWHKAEAKRLFAELEAHQKNGTRTPCAELVDARNA